MSQDMLEYSKKCEFCGETNSIITSRFCTIVTWACKRCHRIQGEYWKPVAIHLDERRNSG